MTWDLRLGSCLDPAVGLPAMADNSVDVTISDPPFEAEAHTKQRRVFNGGGDRGGAPRMAALSFAPMTEEDRVLVAGHMARVTRRWIVLFCQIEAAHLWSEALVDGGARYVRTGIWRKVNGQPQMTGDRPGMGFETIVMAYGSAGRMRWNGGGRHAVWDFPMDANFSREPRFHETQKPLPLIASLTSDFSEIGETVLDPYAGSATGGVAAVQSGREWIGYEIDPRYHALATKRLEGTREQGGLFVKMPKAKQGALL